MVATAYMWVLGRKVVVTRLIDTVEASNEDRALLMVIRKKDMTNNITIIMTFMMLEPLNWSPSVCETDFQLSGGDYQLSDGVYQLNGSYFQLKKASPQLTVLQTFNSLPTQIPTQSVFSNSKLHSWRGKFFTNGGANFSLMVGLHGKPSPATSGRCPWTAPPPSSRSHTSASVRENRSHLQEKLQFYGPLKVQHPLYRGRHSHLGLKS